MSHEYKIFEGRAPLAPAQCIITGTRSDPLIDTGKNVPYYGRVYISAREFAIMAHQFGFLSPSQAEEKDSQITHLAEEIGRQEEEIIGLRDALDGGIADLRDYVVGGGRFEFDPVAVAGAEDDGNGGGGAGDGALGDGERVADDDEPARGEGPDGVRESADHDAVPRRPAGKRR